MRLLAASRSSCSFGVSEEERGGETEGEQAKRPTGSAEGEGGEGRGKGEEEISLLLLLASSSTKSR